MSTPPESWTPTEQRLLRAVRQDQPLDLRARADDVGRPLLDELSEAEVSAGVLAALLLLPPTPAAGVVPRLRLTGARITGRLRLPHAEVRTPIALVDCRFDEPVDLGDAVLRAVDFTGCQMPELHADGLRTDGDLTLVRLASGKVSLFRAQIGGNLWLNAARGSGSLRSIGAGGEAVAARTDTQLGALTVLPGVRIFRGIRAGHPSRVIATHAVSAGRLVVLVESVAWPPGDYRVDPDGQVWCDGMPTGQATAGLQAAVAACRGRLPRDHRVRALICVHRTTPAGYLLPVPGRTVSWTFAEDLVETLMPHLAPHAAAVSRHVVAALAG